MRSPLAIAVGVAMAASSLVALSGPVTAQAAEANASGTCARSLETDASESETVDILTVSASYDCTYEWWQFQIDLADDATEDTVYVQVEFETDGDPETGCEGYDYIAPWPNPGSSAVFKASSCNVFSSGPNNAYGSIYEDGQGGLEVTLHGAPAGHPDVVSYRVIAEASDGSLDFAPDGRADYRIDRTAPQPPRPVAQARTNADSCPAGVVPEDNFVDVPAGSVHESAIDCVVYWQVAKGVGGGLYAPSQVVTRAQMASFVARMVVQAGASLPPATRDYFADDNGLVHEDSINRLAEAEIISLSHDGQHFPGGPMTRAVMARYITRAYDHIAREAGQEVLRVAADYFPDDDHSFESSINKAAAAGFTAGYTDGTFRPDESVPRDQMASFLTRVLDLAVETGASTAP